jgi:tetratricopeptide (TPR) repeat protein
LKGSWHTAYLFVKIDKRIEYNTQGVKMKNRESQNIGDKISDFVQKNRKGIFVSFAVLIILFLGFVAFLFISDSQNKKAIAEFEEINRNLSELSIEETDELLEKMSVFAGKNKVFAGSRAWSVIGQIYIDREEWELAEEAWLNAAKAAPKTYLGPIALFQAAAVSEEQGKYEQAIDLYNQSITSKFDFPFAARAQFSIGRLYEHIGDFPSAVEAYRAVLINWSEIPVWQHLARSRIIAIEIE